MPLIYNVGPRVRLLYYIARAQSAVRAQLFDAARCLNIGQNLCSIS